MTSNLGNARQRRRTLRLEELSTQRWRPGCDKCGRRAPWRRTNYSPATAQTWWIQHRDYECPVGVQLAIEPTSQNPFEDLAQ